MSEDKNWADPWDTTGQTVYKEGENQSQGEYHESNPSDSIESWQGNDQQNNQSDMHDQQNNYWQNTNGHNMYQEPQPKPSQAFGIASLVLGILSLLCFYSCCNILPAVLAIIFGIVQLAMNKSGKGMAIAGIITSILSVVLLIAFYAMFMFSTDFQSMLDEELKNPDLYEYYNYYDDLLPDDYNLEEDFDFDGDDTF